MSYAEHLSKHVRIALLRVLKEAPAYRANDSILHSAADHLGLSISRDQVKSELTWLFEQGLVALELLPNVMVATATGRGVDVAEGRIAVPGVQRPSPKG